MPFEKTIAALKETLRQVNYQNEMMLKWVNGAVVILDRQGRIIDANPAALHSFGYSLEELIGQPLHETVHHSQDDGSEYPWDFCPIFAAIEDGSSHHVDGDVFWNKDRSSFSTDFIACPTRDDNNEITGAVVIFRNLTEQKMGEASRIHSMKLESLGVLAAGVAHEINTPIQFIGSNIAFLQESFTDLLNLVGEYAQLKEVLTDEEKRAEVLARIELCESDADIDYLLEETPKAFHQTQEGVDRVTKLVLSLKGFAHSGNTETKRPTDLNDIINNSLTVSQNAYKYVAELKTKLEKLPPINILPGDVGQVIVNLVVNAAHAIEDQKKIDGKMGTITVSSRCDDQAIYISVADTGAGIPAGLLERIFDPFFTTKDMGQGSGQGLAISRKIIHEKHQGELSVTSTVGQGTVFSITLPLQ